MESMEREISEKDLLLAELINNFYQDKLSADHFKKMCDDYNSTIKTMFNEMNISEFETESGLVAKVIIQNRESFKEKELIKKLMELNLNEVIELVPTINYDKLEDMIYNGKIDAATLSEYKVVKQVPTLKVTQKKSK